MGNNGLDLQNEKGRSLIEFFCSNHLAITNTFFNPISYMFIFMEVTWQHDKEPNQLCNDTITLETEYPMDKDLFLSADCGSDPQLLASNTKLKLKKTRHLGDSLLLDLSRMGLR